jgi:hypothetical protein
LNKTNFMLSHFTFLFPKEKERKGNKKFKML